MKNIKDLGIPPDILQEIAGFAHNLEHTELDLRKLAHQRRDVDRWAMDFSRRVDRALSGPDSETFLGNILYHFLRQTGHCISLRNTEKQIASGVDSLIKELRGSDEDMHFALDIIQWWLEDQVDARQINEKTCGLLRILLRKLTNKEVPPDLSVPAERRVMFSLATKHLEDPGLDVETRVALEQVIYFINLQNQPRAQDLTMDGIDAEVESKIKAADLSIEAADIFTEFNSMAQLDMAYKIFFAIATHLGVEYDYPSDES